MVPGRFVGLPRESNRLADSSKAFAVNTDASFGLIDTSDQTPGAQMSLMIAIGWFEENSLAIESRVSGP
jgi:hypothetical protein